MTTAGSAGARRPLPLPDPPLVDGDLALRPWSPAEAGTLVAAWQDPEVARWTGVPPEPGEELARRWIEGDEARRRRGLALDLVVVVADQVVGEVGLAHQDGAGRAEIGWWIAAPWRGRGLATRAVALLAGWATGPLGLDAVVARCHPDNPASAGVARAAGFALLGVPDATETWVWPGAAAATIRS